MNSERVDAAIGVLKAEVASLDPATVDQATAHRLFSLLDQGQRVCAGGTALLASRVGDPAALARHTGTSVGKARDVLTVSRRLADTPVLADAVRRATVSLDQATQIAKAETQAPGSAADLVRTAEQEPFHELCRKARDVVLADERTGLGDRQRRARRASHHVTDLGMIHIEADLEPHLGTPIVTRLEAEARRLAKAATEEEPFAAHLADAFVRVVEGAGGGEKGRTEMVVLVSHEVAAGGWTDVADGAVCKIPGVGPIDPQVAKTIASDAFLTGVCFDGKDLRHVRRWTRSIPAEVRIALRLGDPPDFDGPRCVDCGNRLRLEYDHLVPFGAGGPTALSNLGPRCEPCHQAKTARDRKASAASASRPATTTGAGTATVPRTHHPP